MSFLALLAAVVVTLLVQRPLGLSRRGRALWIGAAIVGPSIVASGLAALWYFHRPQPGPAREWLFRGVLFEQEVRTTPRPIVAHVVTIDLRDPGISFLVTPLDPSWGGVIRAQTTSQFLVRHGAQLAINGDFFDHDFGLNVGNGAAWPYPDTEHSGNFSVGPNRIEMTPDYVVLPSPAPWVTEQLGGRWTLLNDGAPQLGIDDNGPASGGYVCAPGLRHPRTAIGLSRD